MSNAEQARAAYEKRIKEAWKSGTAEQSAPTTQVKWGEMVVVK